MQIRDLYVEGHDATLVVKALANDVRLKILDMLDEQDLNLQAIEEHLLLSKTAVLNHINLLEAAGLITTRYLSGSVGNQKVCSKTFDRMIFNFTPQRENDEQKPYYDVQVSPGNYFDFSIYPPCGLADTGHVLRSWDDPSVFFSTERVKAKMIWCAYGFLEYRFPLNIPFEDLGLNAINIMLEISAQGGLIGPYEGGSDAPHSSLILPEQLTTSRITEGCSDITFWLGGLEVGTIQTKEFSRYGHEGRYTPKWWRGSAYGNLVSIWIDGNGTRIGNNLASDVTLTQLLHAIDFERDRQLKTRLISSDSLSFRIGIKQDAEHISGFNIYGNGFGNYPMDIVARFY